MTKYLSKTLLLTQLALGVACFSACQTEDTKGAEAEQTGRLELNLVAHGESGTTYRLREAIIVVQGPSSTIFIDSESDLDAEVFSATVPVGSYTYFLQEGWSLERVGGGDGGVETVDAQLASGNSGAFEVFANSRTSVPLRFRVGDAMLDEGGFDLSIEVEESGPTQYCTGDAECSQGETCCIAGFLGTCRDLTDGAACPLPDLVVSEEAASGSWDIRDEYFPEESCAVAEQCVDAPGQRRLLRFSTQTDNVGQSDLVLGDPTSAPGFEFSECHGHYHFEGYAQYELVGANGEIAATGHKQAFCLMDIDNVGGSNDIQPFHCQFQGLHQGWGDVYGAGLDCQWVDITDVAAGDYTLRITVNPERDLPESDYDNNTAEIAVSIWDPGTEDPLRPCNQGGFPRECGWELAEGYQGVSCTPGEELNVSCGCDCGGDPILRVCDGSEACVGSEALGANDDSCSLCSETTVVCPASGTYTVMLGSYSANQDFACELRINSPADAGAGASADEPEDGDAGAP